MGVRHLDDSEIAKALARSESLKQAAADLGTGTSALELRCRRASLNSLYEACADRGRSRRGGGKQAKSMPLTHWFVIMDKPPRPAVQVWDCYAVNREEAMKLALNVTKGIAARSEVSVVEDATVEVAAE